MKRIDIYDDNMDLRPGSIFRGLLPFLIGPNWEDYVTIYIVDKGENTMRLFDRWKMHNEEGPAAIKKDGTMEWWLDGKKLFCQTQKEFECYMRNKAFW